MIIDNKNDEKKIFELLRDYTDSGKMDIVTGYFTIGALNYFAQARKEGKNSQDTRTNNEKIEQFRMILGELIYYQKENPIDLLNENINIQSALQVRKQAKQAVEFLEQKKVFIKTLEPNFCHAKLYHFKPEGKEDDKDKYYITGSSNLTEAGIGLKKTNNIELNVAETGKSDQYKNLDEWLENLWNCSEAKTNVLDEEGKKTKQTVKDALIEKIKSIFKEYTPAEIYHKIIYELFKDQLEDQSIKNEKESLEKTTIYQSLYEFQKKGVLSLIKIIQKEGGAILADAVGLGKTWSALAVMKYFSTQGYKIVLICPKKLFNNWNRYRENQESRFEADKINYFIRHHTCLNEKTINKTKYKEELSDTCFTSDEPRLFVIDESHNLRNAKSNRYIFLVEQILQQQKTDKTKVLLLSATPINNSLKDIKNQFKLLKKGKNNGFAQTHNIKNLDDLFNRAQEEFKKWSIAEDPKISQFIKKLPANFFKLSDSLIVARTRKMIEKKGGENLTFLPKKTPKNISITPKKIGKYDTFENLVDSFPPKLSGYQPNYYIVQTAPNKFQDNKQRERYLVKMLYILLIKRLESSWHSFHSTFTKISDYHKLVLEKLKSYDSRQNVYLNAELNDGVLEKVVVAEDWLGKKKHIVNITEIVAAGNLAAYQEDLTEDLDSFAELEENFAIFKESIEKETGMSSKDEKLQSLMEEIREKQKQPNPKVLIFTAYKDTAFYLFKELKKRGFEKLAVVSGDNSKTSDEEAGTKNFEPILERFAPYTKLFNEKNWEFTSTQKTKQDQYEDWKRYLAKSEQYSVTKQKLANPIDILIATDVLSEGQNLQDCDLVINYDIHWNPVRILQRVGRIDRIGSPNKEIATINYWPSASINDYLNLKKRVESKMAAMKLAGSEVNPEFTDDFKKMSDSEEFEAKNSAKTLRQMRTSLEDIETDEAKLSFSNFSLETHRQNLLMEMNKKPSLYKTMPKAVYTGFQQQPTQQQPTQQLIALLGYPVQKPKTPAHQYKEHYLIYIDEQGNPIKTHEREILDYLSQNKTTARFVPKQIDKGEEQALAKLKNTFENWFRQQTETTITDPAGIKTKLAGKQTLAILDGLKSNDTSTHEKLKQNQSPSQKFKIENFDLIAWFIIT